MALSKLTRKGACLLGLALLLTTPAIAGQIKAGFDFWQTVGSGATAYDFAGDPLPAGFFCPGSAPFTGEVTFEGQPLATDPPHALGTTDTIVERLYPATFDSKGKASTRIKVRALDLRGREVISNECGDWTVTVKLNPDQPITTMTFQQSDLCPENGEFSANLVVDVTMVFIEGTSGATRSVSRIVSLPTFVNVPYAIGQAASQCVPNAYLPIGQNVAVMQGNFTVYSADNFSGACYCNCEGTMCLPLTSQHDGPDEDHFIMPPCEFFGEPCEEYQAVVDEIYQQMEDLYSQGIIDEDPATATDNIVNKVY